MNIRTHPNTLSGQATPIDRDKVDIIANKSAPVALPISVCWEFLWRENDVTGERVRRTAVIGTVEQFPTEDLALAAVNGLRMSINVDRNPQREQFILVGDLVDHYIHTELSERADWHSHATRVVYREFLKRWIRPQWAGVGHPRGLRPKRGEM
jgi:hypothetical protein